MGQQKSKEKKGVSTQVQQLLKRIKEGISKIQSSDDWAKWLAMRANFWHFSFQNQLLIALQKPMATYVAGYKAWEKMERQVNRGEKAIRILAPLLVKAPKEDEEKEDGKTAKVLRGFRVVNVFDLGQTSGKTLPQIAHPLKGNGPAGIFEKMQSFIEAKGYKVSFEDTPEGLYGFLDSQKRIVLRKGEARAQSLKTLAHEIGHALGGHLSKDHAARDERELEAESCAFVVCTALGLDSSQYSFGYLASWAQASDRNEKLLRAAGKASKVAATILKGLGDPGLMVAA